ncbi:DUF5343 domain-containing protein [Mycolicibacterium stellerae]|uniref:DUF5343 domain-containing protein n=1 Tax=Mycolicibacterium stellerae TaxID=2358193 RepID=UPI000F0B1384|nr:DUF5343 domain-containing protein [Mycolicibacterium stellerae]
MLTQRYLVSTKNLDAILKKIVDGVAPDKFNSDHLKSIGFGGSGDRSMVPLLKDLGFLTADGTPTPRYHAYRDGSRSKVVLAEALREAYEDVFHIREVPTSTDRPAVEGLFKSKHNSTDKVAQLQAMTFYALLKHADMKAAPGTTTPVPQNVQREDPHATKTPEGDGATEQQSRTGQVTAELHYTIQIHLPATKDIEVFNAIFRSLRENLLS